MVGELPSPEGLPGLALQDGDAIALAGPFAPALAGSELAKLRGELEPGLAEFDVAAIGEAIAAVRRAVRSGRIRVAHDISDGGLAAALAECAIAGGVGLDVDVSELAAKRGDEPEAWLFGEGPGGFVLAGEVGEIATFVEEGLAVAVGAAGGDAIRIGAGEAALSLPVADAAAAWRSLGERMNATP
jgi:phosphoribosylformylglycinamidine synthase